ncbi:unnamed protein product [Phaeothamnion confervicola]
MLLVVPLMNRRRRRRPGYVVIAPLLALCTSLILVILCSASNNPLEFNGGSCVAMAGKDCVALAVDKRFGSREQLVSANARRVLKLNSRLLCGFTGLATDIQTAMQDVSLQVSAKAIAEGRPIAPRALSALLSALLYARRASPWYVEPVVAGLDARGSPFLSAHDLLGAPLEAPDFVVAGTSSAGLYGMCEALFREGMAAEELVETVSRCLLSALERDCLSGYGAVVHLVTREGVTSRELKSRMD